MAAINPAGAFQARCSVQHIPPADPFFITNKGFRSVRIDTTIIAAGAYTLELDDTNLDMTINMIVGQYRSEIITDLGVIFFGNLSVVEPPGQFSLVRFQVLPGNITLDGPFMVSVINCQ